MKVGLFREKLKEHRHTYKSFGNSIGKRGDTFRYKVVNDSLKLYELRDVVNKLGLTYQEFKDIFEIDFRE